MAGVTEHPNKNDFRCGVDVERSGHEEIRKRDAVGCFGPDDLEGREGGRQDCAADESVGYCGEDGVVARGETLQSVCGFDAETRVVNSLSDCVWLFSLVVLTHLAVVSSRTSKRKTWTSISIADALDKSSELT